MVSSRARTLLAGGLLSLAATARLLAQGDAELARRWDKPSLGLYAQLGLGRGRFEDFVKNAVGFGGYVTLPTARGALALRADLSVLYHAFESWPWTPPIETKSYITSFRTGPQVAVGIGRVRVYGFGAGGFSYFATEARFDAQCDCSFTTTLRDDWTWATEIGGGVRVALGGPPSAAGLDFGIRALRHSEATYVTQGDITQNADGSFTLHPHRTQAHLLVIQLGVSGLGP